MSLATIKAWIDRRARRDTETPSVQVKRLYGMLHVEHGMAKITAELDDQYVNGRIGGYRFVIQAMELYWPDLVPEGMRLRDELDDIQ